LKLDGSRGEDVDTEDQEGLVEAFGLRPARSAFEAVERHTLAVIVDNEAGVLARVIGLFSGRGYNIESLTVAEVDHEGHRSRITVVTRGTPSVIDQIRRSWPGSSRSTRCTT
jgi:acetolactate synthase regulatory subunit